MVVWRSLGASHSPLNDASPQFGHSIDLSTRSPALTDPHNVTSLCVLLSYESISLWSSPMYCETSSSMSLIRGRKSAQNSCTDLKSIFSSLHTSNLITCLTAASALSLLYLHRNDSFHYCRLDDDDCCQNGTSEMVVGLVTNLLNPVGHIVGCMFGKETTTPMLDKV